jgi:hypothetical protein
VPIVIDEAHCIIDWLVYIIFQPWEFVYNLTKNILISVNLLVFLYIKLAYLSSHVAS